MSNDLKSLNKKQLLGIISKMGYKNDFVEWLKKRYNTRRLVTLIENARALDIIARVAGGTNDK